MQEQNFEKQVQKKMEELNLSPSAPVWKKVEERIRKKKDRRRIFFWLIPFALLGGGVYFYSVSNKPVERTSATNVTPEILHEKNNDNQTTPVINQDNTTTSKNQSSLEQKQSIPAPANKTASEKIIAAKASVSKIARTYPETKNPAAYRKDDQDVFNRKNLINTEEKSVETTEVIQQANSTNGDERVQNNGPTQGQDNEKITGNHTEKPADDISVNNNQVVTDSSLNNVVNDSINKTPSPSEAKDSMAVASANENNTLQKTQAKTKAKKPWKWRTSLAGGGSGIAVSAFGNLSQGGAASLDATRFYNVRSFSLTNGPVAAMSYPSDIKNGFSFAAGAGLDKELSKRLQFTTGLFYQFYSSSITVGKKIYQADTITRENKNIRVDNFYQSSNSGETSTRKNNYHFIELPLGIDWQVTKNIPLQMQTGFRIGRLIQTNALHYDGQQGIYYEDEELFKRTQFSFYTSISYRILKINRASLYIGPKAQFQLSNLLKKKSFGEQHLYFTGLQTYVSF